MKKVSCLVALLMVFSQVGAAELHENSHVKPIDLNKRGDLARAGVTSLASVAYDAVLQRAQLRTQQAKGLIDKVHTKVRSVLGLPPPPKKLVEGEFLETLDQEEKQKLEDKN